ncbi:MAG: hypothetical protein N2115_07445 [bacterium]|nr:hypothetical protein [bacterium]
MKLIFLSFQNSYQLFCRNKINGSPIEKCNIENLKGLQKKCRWSKSIIDPLSELHYFRFFQYPENKFPGLSIIRAKGKNVEINEDSSYFLADFMTVDGSKIVGFANISENETKSLAEEIAKTFDYFGFKVVRPGQILIWFQEKYPFTNWKHPYQLINKNYREYLPQSGSIRPLARIIENSSRILEKHPVNRVRIDLGENPANLLWLHGQSKEIKTILPLREKIGLRTLYWSNNHNFSDIAVFLGFEICHHNPIKSDDSLIWLDFESKTEDIIGLMRALELIDKEIIGTINNSYYKIVIEFNDGLYSRRVLNFLYPVEKKGFLERVRFIRKTPGNFLLCND